MDPLLEQLTTQGVLDRAGAEWAVAHQARMGGPLSSALLELDLVDEVALLDALEATYGVKGGRLADLEAADTSVGQRLPQSVSRSFCLCPIRQKANDLVVLVEFPLPDESLQELVELFGIRAIQLIAPAHYLALARARVYASPLDDSTRELETRLERRRTAPPIQEVLEKLATPQSIARALDAVLEHAGHLLECPACLFLKGQQLDIVTLHSGQERRQRVQAPGPGSALGPALHHSGYFFGPVPDSGPDQHFFQAWGRALPARAFVAPVPSRQGARVALYCDNGPRGMPARWVAELTLLAARLGQIRAGAPPRVPVEAASTPIPATAELATPARTSESSQEPAPAIVTASSAPPAVPPAIDPAERVVLERLKAAAARAGLSLEALVEELLRGREAWNAPAATSAVMSEVKGLFERLATDIPANLARGMEAAFRDLVPRLAPVAAATQAQPIAPPIATPSPQLAEIVIKPAGPREVASYQSKRQKTKAIKL